MALIDYPRYIGKTIGEFARFFSIHSASYGYTSKYKVKEKKK